MILEAAEIEVGPPEGAGQQSGCSRVGGHAGGGVHLGEDLRLGPCSPGRQGVKSPGAAHHQPVAGAQAGDEHKDKQYGAPSLAKDSGESQPCAMLPALHHDGVGDCSGDAHIVEQIDQHDDAHPADQGQGQGALRVLELRVDGGGHHPALIGEGRGGQGGEEGVGGNGVGGDLGEVGGGHAAPQPCRSAHPGHEQDGDQLDEGHGDLELAGQTGGHGVDEVGGHQIEQGDGHALAADDVVAQQDTGIAGGHPGQGAGQTGIVDRGQEPAQIVAVGPAYGGLGIVHHAPHLLIAGGHDGKGAGVGDGDQAADDPGQDACAQVAAGGVEDLFRFEKDAAADDDADHHADGGRQAVFFRQLLLQSRPPPL